MIAVVFRSNKFDTAGGDLEIPPDEPPLGKDCAEWLVSKLADRGARLVDVGHGVVEPDDTPCWTFMFDVSDRSYHAYLYSSPNWVFLYASIPLQARYDPPEDYWVLYLDGVDSLLRALVRWVLHRPIPEEYLAPAEELVQAVLVEDDAVKDVRWFRDRELFMIAGYLVGKGDA